MSDRIGYRSGADHDDKKYLGDAVYAEFDGCGIWLSTKEGCPDDPTNSIYLEPETCANLLRFIERHFQVIITTHPATNVEAAS